MDPRSRDEIEQDRETAKRFAQEKNPGQLETWAIVEVMGHGRYAGFVQQVPMGGAAMIRVDVPEIQACDEEYEEYDYAARASVKRTRTVAGTPAFTKFLGVSSIFAITPCSQETAIQAVRQFRSAPVNVLHITTSRPMLARRESDED